MIKHLHFVWGGPEMPERFRENLRIWSDLHPDWDLTLWGDNDLGWLKHRELYDDAADYVPDDGIWQFRSDLARYEILAKHGGFYADVDTFPLQNIEPAVEGSSLWAARENRKWFGNTYLYCEPGHPAMQRILDGIESRLARFRSQRRASVLTGPIYITPILRRYRCDVGETRQWFPISYKQAALGEVPEPDDDTYAVHEWFHVRTVNGLT